MIPIKWIFFVDRNLDSSYQKKIQGLKYWIENHSDNYLPLRYIKYTLYELKS